MNDIEIDAFIGARMKSRRTALKISQTKLAEAIGVRFQQVQKYESGANRVSASRLLAVAKHLNVPVSYFFDGIDGLTETASANAAISMHALSNNQVAEILALVETLPKDQQEAVMAFLRSLSETTKTSEVA